MYARIPFATNPSGVATPALLNADGYLVSAPAITQTYTTLRTLSTASSDTVPPTSGSFAVSIARAPYADVLIVGSAVAGTVSPDSITWKIWRLVGSIVEQVDQYEMDAVNIATPVTRTVLSGTDKLWITATLNGGSSPTVSAVVSIRPVADGGITQSKLLLDSLGYLLTRAASYDSPTNSDKVFPIYDISDKFANETPLDLTGTSVVTANYDINMNGYSRCNVQIVAANPVDGYIKFAVQATNDTASSPDFATITASGTNCSLATFSPDVSGDISVPSAGATYFIKYNDIGCNYLRVKVTVGTAHANNALQINTYKYY